MCIYIYIYTLYRTLILQEMSLFSYLRFYCHLLPVQPILWSTYFLSEPVKTPRKCPRSISEGGKIWQVKSLLPPSFLPLPIIHRKNRGSSASVLLLFLLCSASVLQTAVSSRRFGSRNFEPSVPDPLSRYTETISILICY